MNAINQCQKCQYKWEAAPIGPATRCLECGHIYVKWLNYEEWEKHHEKFIKKELLVT